MRGERTDMRMTAIVLLMVLTANFSAGCAKEPSGPGNAVLAKIGTYELTVEDFEDEAKLTASNKMLPADRRKAREELLDELIMKKVLLQEAERQHLDRGRAFMKEIERYWEQALIKMMILKKMEELSREAVTKDPAKMQEAFEAWLCDLRARSDVKIFREKL